MGLHSGDKLLDIIVGACAADKLLTQLQPRLQHRGPDLVGADALALAAPSSGELSRQPIRQHQGHH
jgi:hypothetical protein